MVPYKINIHRVQLHMCSQKFPTVPPAVALYMSPNWHAATTAVTFSEQVSSIYPLHLHTSKEISLNQKIVTKVVG